MGGAIAGCMQCRSVTAGSYNGSRRGRQSKGNIVLEPLGKHRNTIVWLHGLGDPGGEGSHALWSELCGSYSSVFRDCRIVIPSARKIRVTAQFGMKMCAWYDILKMDVDWEEEDGDVSQLPDEDAAGIKSAALRVHGIIAEERKLLGDSRRLFLGGFSQGGALAIWAGLRAPEPLAGVLCCSGYAALMNDYPEGIRDSVNKDIPVFGYHGTHDRIVPLFYAELGYQRLKNSGCKLHLKSEYGLQHNVSDLEVKEMISFLQAHGLEKPAERKLSSSNIKNSEAAPPVKKVAFRLANKKLTEASVRRRRQRRRNNGNASSAPSPAEA